MKKKSVQQKEMRGGARIRSGRKKIADKKVSVSLRVKPLTNEQLARISESLNISRGEVG
jgi:hypothetical protein